MWEMHGNDSMNLNETLADAVMDRPREFFIGRKRYCLWSPTLGMSILVSRHIEALGIDEKMMSLNPYMEAVRLAREKRDEMCYILAILSFRTYLELTNTQTLKRRAGIFSRSLDDEDIASLALIALREPKAETLISLSGIEKDQLEQQRISRHKNKDGHSQLFGGKTIFGSLIAVACSTFGWTKEYVVWGIDLVSLKMMLADTISSIYLSDDDIKELRINSTSRQVYGMTPEDIAKLKAMDWD